MGATATERVALLFETRADLSGAEAVRKETTALGQAAAKATQDVAAASAAGATAEKNLATATTAAVTEQGKLVATIEQTREAWAKSGGDMEAFKRNLAEAVGAEQKLAAAAKATGDEIAKQAAQAARATSQYGQPIGPQFAGVAGSRQLGPAGAGPQTIGPQLGPALPGLSTAAAAEASAKAYEQLTPKARQAGNAINVLAQAAATGNGSIAGLATAVGNAAQGISAMSGNAKIAASAAGIGALGAALGLLIALAIEAKQKLDAIPEGKLSAADAGHLKNLHTEQDVQEQLAALDARRLQLQSQLQAFGGAFGGKDALKNQAATLQAIVDLDAQRLALADRRVAITNEERARSLAAVAIETAAQTTAVGRYQAQLRQIESERIEAIRTHSLTEEAANRQAADKRHDLAKEGRDFTLQLAAETAAAEVAVTREVFRDRQQAEASRYAAEKRALEDRSLSAEAYKKALDDIEKKHEAILNLMEGERSLLDWMAALQSAATDENLATSVSAKLDLIEEAKQASIRAGVSEVTATAVAERQKRQLYLETARVVASSLKSIEDITANSNNERTKAIHNFVKNVRAVELGYEAVKATISSLREGAEAIAAAGRGDFGGAALHAAAAVKFAAVAAVAGNEAGGGGAGGGAGGGGGGSAASGTTFQPSASEDAGSQTIILQTIDPYSREKINEVQYLIGRAGVLKRPINIPPTTGLQGAA